MTDARERSAPVGERRWHALRESLAWLAHPVSLAAIAVLVVNDHVLKEAYGNWWTGKLSDFAGLVFFPALLAVALAALAPRAPFRQLALVSVATTGVGFTWVKATEIGATTASASWSLVAGPSIILRDPTDLIALPMLALAAALALRARPRPRAVLTAIALPFAVLATAATSAPLNPSATVIADQDGGPVLVVEGGGYYGDVPVYQREPDGSWLEISAPSATSREAGEYASAPHACVNENTNICFRPLAGAIGVERTTDAGQTWRVDWILSEQQLGTLREAYYLGAGTEGTLITHGVAVVPTQVGFQVIAANGPDGIAVRDENGDWKREGWTSLDCCDFVHIAKIDGTPHPWEVLEPLPWPIAWGMVAFVLAFGVIASSSPRTFAKGTWSVVRGSAIVAFGVAWSGLAIWMNWSGATRVPDGFILRAVVAFNLVLGLVIALGGGSMVIGAPRRAFMSALRGATAVTVVVVAAVALVPGAHSTTSLVAAIALAVGIASVLRFSRTRNDHHVTGNGG